MSSSVHNDNKNKDILILGEGPTQGFGDATLTAEAKYPINFTQSGKRPVLSLLYNESNEKFPCECKKRHVCEKRLYLESFYV